MADDRFFKRAGPFSLGELAQAANAEIANAPEPSDAQYLDVAPLQTATPGDVSFLDNRKYADAFKETQAGACVVHPEMAQHAPKGTALLITKEPYHGYARIAQVFYPGAPTRGRIDPTAVVATTSKVADSVDIGANACIGENVVIGAGCRIGANSVIDDGVRIGDNTNVGPNVTIQCADIGAECIIHPGVRIGQDGFGFAMGPGGHVKVPQLGRVLIGDDVEIGANTTIDRGTGPDTVIGRGTKIDNLAQIGHNARIGENCVLVSQVGISGSTELGDFVVMGGQTGVAGHLHIGSGVQIAAQSGIMRDVPPGQRVAGAPAKPAKQWFREQAVLEGLAKKRGK